MKRAWVIVLLSLLLLIGALFFLIRSLQQKMAYVDTVKLYESFILKKELETKLKKVEDARTKILDSLMLNLQVMSKNIETAKQRDQNEVNRFEAFREQYLQKKKEFEEDNSKTAQSYTDQVWAQLNQYIKEYGKMNEYKFIFGTTGNGNLMYAREGDDVSKELIEYVNEKYSGK